MQCVTLDYNLNALKGPFRTQLLGESKLKNSISRIIFWGMFV